MISNNALIIIGDSYATPWFDNKVGTQRKHWLHPRKKTPSSSDVVVDVVVTVQIFPSLDCWI